MTPSPNPQSSEVEAIVKKLFLEKSIVVSNIDGFAFSAIRHKELQEIVTNLTQQHKIDLDNKYAQGFNEGANQQRVLMEK